MKRPIVLSSILLITVFELTFAVHATSFVKNTEISLGSLLDELVSYDAVVSYPSPSYKAAQVSSYDRRTVSPTKPGWFANNDGFGFVRLDSIEGRVEKVLFEKDGPGVITRIWLTTSDKRGILRIYFDGSSKPEVIIPAYDTSLFPVQIGQPLSLTHTHYQKDLSKTGGTTSFLPLPYAKSCRITFEETSETAKAAHYYQIGYRSYVPGTKVKTFTLEEMKFLKGKIALVNERLLNPPVFTQGTKSVSSVIHSNVSLQLPSGNRAVCSLHISISGFKADDYKTIMNQLWLCIDFDGARCVYAPLANFFSGGKEAPAIHNWYFSSDGKGCLDSRWVMPYKQKAVITIEKAKNLKYEATITAFTKPMKWTQNMLYFHSTCRAEQGIPVNNDADSNDNLDWNFTTLQGRGVYCGDLLSVYNYCPDWYGEGDEKIWIDNDAFPSFMGTGTEDYYNCSWAPVVPFDTSFGGAPTAEEASSHGKNAFYRMRNLDVIPFNKQLKFDIEMLSWHKGKVDYETTVFWYGK